MKHSFLNACIGLVLACNYFAFQVELFDDEYEANHPAQAKEGTHALTNPSVTWESFDKDNAPEPFVFDARISLVSLFELSEEVPLTHLHSPSPHPIRDKSPPLLSASQEHIMVTA